MSTRRRIVAVWAALCLCGLAATSALNAEPSMDTPEPPAGEPTPTGAYTVDCQEIADYIEQIRAESERERQKVLGPSATPVYRGTTAWDVAVPEECADKLEDRGLKTH